MNDRRLVIAGTGSNVGKTTITIGIMSALKKMGYTVQGFKCGPDYIDPFYHTAITGRSSRNLDSWMLSHDAVNEIFIQGSEGACISIIEGVMGFYDGKDPKINKGSSAEISIITQSPVILVVDCSGVARSAAAIVRGFQILSDEVNIVGVIANKVSGENHFLLIKEAVEQECGIPVVGNLSQEKNIKLPERHLGLIPPIELGELTSFFDRLGESVLSSLDMKLLFDLAKTTDLKQESSFLFNKKDSIGVRIAIAYDQAFSFYYEENLELLRVFGAELVYFSPLAGEPLPSEIHGLYLGGGFPEVFAETLSKQTNVHLSIKSAIQQGLPTFAECGGFMYLCESIVTLDGSSHSMVGIIPGTVKMQNQLVAVGYREIHGEKGNDLLKEGESAMGHEFHYSTFHPKEKIQFAYETKGNNGIQKEGFLKKNLIAGYTHIHFASCPHLVENWIKKCMEWKISL